MDAAVATMCFNSASSAAAMITKFGQAAEIGEIERTGMRRAVRADEPGAINREPHRQTLDRDVVHDLIVAALKERRIDRGERLHAFGREARSKSNRVLLGDADIKRAVRKFAAEYIEARAVRHRGRDRDDLVVLFGFGDQAVGEHARIGRRDSLAASPARRSRH